MTTKRKLIEEIKTLSENMEKINCEVYKLKYPHGNLYGASYFFNTVYMRYGYVYKNDIKEVCIGEYDKISDVYVYKMEENTFFKIVFKDEIVKYRILNNLEENCSDLRDDLVNTLEWIKLQAQ